MVEEDTLSQDKRLCECGCGEEVTSFNHQTWPRTPSRFKRGHRRAKYHYQWWKGGIVIDSGGYRRVFMPSHPNTNSRGYILEHVLVMTEMLGRPLQSGEVVHHKDGNRLNNSKDNLRLMTRSQHTSHHRYLNTLSISNRKCIKCKHDSTRVKHDRWYKTKNENEFICVICYNNILRKRRD